METGGGGEGLPFERIVAVTTLGIGTPSAKISRRGFLKAAGILLGASAAACSGLGYVATREPQALETETPQFAYGEAATMNRRILVAYATRTGSTVGVASAIGETLGASGFDVDVKPVKENPGMDGYQAVVIGSAVNGAQWLPEAVQFVKNNQSALNRVPVALFSVHIMNLAADEKSRQNRLAYLNTVRPLLKPLDEGFFAGVGFDPMRQSWLAGLLNRVFKMAPDGDCRDWNTIRAWAANLSPVMAANVQNAVT